MAIKVGINGFGRIGRGVVRAYFKKNYPGIEIVHINDLSSREANAHMFKYDSVHGKFDGNVELSEKGMKLNGKEVTFSAERDPKVINWGQYGVDVVMECTGIFRKREQAEIHIAAGAKKVLISAPGSGEDLTVVHGVNSDKIKPEYKILSNGSCTTNCLAPVAMVIDQHFGIKHGLMTTVHSYTRDQELLDGMHEDLRRARAAAVNMVPSTTGAAKAIGLVLPQLKGKMEGMAIRVPTPNVSLVDVTFIVEKATDAKAVNQVLMAATEGPLKGILGFTMEPIVSSDCNGNPLSSLVDGACTTVMAGTMVKVLSWYDNEMGFSHRMLDIAALMAK